MEELDDPLLGELLDALLELFVLLRLCVPEDREVLRGETREALEALYRLKGLAGKP